jgi:hypothetical protein
LPTPQPTTTGSAIAQASVNLPSEGILYIEYEYIDHLNQTALINRRDEDWIDLSDPGRFRQERHLRTRENTPPGQERYTVGNGVGSVFKTCTLYEKGWDCQQQPISDTHTLDLALRAYLGGGRHYVANKDNPSVLNGFVYKGIQTDEQWGEVHAFERTGPLWDGTPAPQALFTLLFDTKMLRRVEERRVVQDTGELGMLVRLRTWDVLDPATVPPDLFTSEVSIRVTAPTP